MWVTDDYLVKFAPVTSKKLFRIKDSWFYVHFLLAILQRRQSDITWESRRLKSPTIPMFVQSFISIIHQHDQNRQQTHLRGEYTGDQWISLTKGQWREKYVCFMTSSWIFLYIAVMFYAVHWNKPWIYCGELRHTVSQWPLRITQLFSPYNIRVKSSNSAVIFCTVFNRDASYFAHEVYGYMKWGIWGQLYDVHCDFTKYNLQI